MLLHIILVVQVIVAKLEYIGKENKMTYAVIKNNIVENVIIADEEFATWYAKENDFLCISYVEQHEDDTLVARIGEAYIDNKFVNANQAIELGLMTKEEALVYGFHSGREYQQSIEEQASELKAQILELNPTAKFPNDVDTNNNEVASIEELQAYLDLLKTKALLNKFEG
jgi:hypothetical protein